MYVFQCRPVGCRLTCSSTRSSNVVIFKPSMCPEEGVNMAPATDMNGTRMWCSKSALFASVIRSWLLQTCDFFVTFSSRSLCSSVYPLFTFSLLSLYLCLFTLSSAPDFIHFTCLLSFHMLLAFYHMHTIFHMLTVITCLPFITCYFIYLDYKIPAVIRRP